MPAIGPRLNGKRIPMSFTDDELVALGGYRNTLRALLEATRDERRVLNEGRSRVALDAAYRRTLAARDAHSAALQALNATLAEE